MIWRKSRKTPEDKLRNLPQQRWANNSVFEYIRIVQTEYIRKPNYSVLFKNRIIFVFVFGFNFQTECIRIRILFLFLNRIHSYSYSVFIFEPNIFVFVFGFYFWTEYIRIRIRSIFRNRIVFAFSGKLKIYIHFYADEIDYTKHIFFLKAIINTFLILMKSLLMMMMILTFLNANIYLVRKKPLSIWTYLFDFSNVSKFINLLYIIILLYYIIILYIYLL